jgi:hypothetical protein
VAGTDPGRPQRGQADRDRQAAHLTDWTTDLAGAPACPDIEIYFDAQVTARRVEAIKAAIAKLVRDAGLSVTSLCRGGFFPTDGWYDENRRGIEEAATLGAPALGLVSGGLPAGSYDLDSARRRVGDGVGSWCHPPPNAGVRLAIEPLHPMFCSDRCVVSSLKQALDLAAPYSAAAVGV